MDPATVLSRSRFLPRRTAGLPVLVVVAMVAAVSLAPLALALVRAEGTPPAVCRAIHLVVDPVGAPDGAIDDVAEAAARVRAASGVAIVVDGVSTGFATRGRVLVTWSGLPRVEGHPRLLGWTSVVETPQGAIEGSVRFSDTQRMAAGFQTRTAWGGAVLHELGHVIGLQHSSDPNDVMYRETVPLLPTTWGPGDRDQLSTIAKRRGCSPPRA